MHRIHRLHPVVHPGRGSLGQEPQDGTLAPLGEMHDAIQQAGDLALEISRRSSLESNITMEKHHVQYIYIYPYKWAISHSHVNLPEGAVQSESFRNLF